MQYVRGSTSTKTGLAPTRAIAPEPLQVSGLVRQVGVDQLERDERTCGEPRDRIDDLGLVDGAHASRPELREESVAAESSLAHRGS